MLLRPGDVADGTRRGVWQDHGRPSLGLLVAMQPQR
jgi:hypothetical protein